MAVGGMSSVVVGQSQIQVLLVCATGELNGMEFTGKNVIVQKITVIRPLVLRQFLL